ncbi:MAG: hypothetical protein H7A37_01575 [Chlamydiales bacterium]|nr:hypothetical protein [Chlamydiia bacterium]MCP5506982.1 hypothetical protein [Chlamydiales bacterium]
MSASYGLHYQSNGLQKQRFSDHQYQGSQLTNIVTFSACAGLIGSLVLEENDHPQDTAKMKLAMCFIDGCLYQIDEPIEEALRSTFDEIIQELEVVSGEYLNSSLKRIVWDKVSEKYSEILKKFFLQKICEKTLNQLSEEECEQIINTNDRKKIEALKNKFDFHFNYKEIIHLMQREAVAIEDDWISEIVNAVREEGIKLPEQYGSSVNRISLVERYRQTLVQMLGEENIYRVNRLGDDTFSPILWKFLTKGDNPTAYHWMIVDELLPGRVWIQRHSFVYPFTSKYEMDTKMSILWTTKPGWIHRAYPSITDEDKVVVESYMSHVLNTRSTTEVLSFSQFRGLIKQHLADTPYENGIICQDPSLLALQRKLEHLPIVFNITKSACENLERIHKEYGDIQVKISVGFAGKQGDKFAPAEGYGVELMEIGKYFIGVRLPYVHEQEGRPEITTEPVAPVINTLDAWGQTFHLRCESSDDFHSLERERYVPKIKSAKEIEGKSLKDLQAEFVLLLGPDARVYNFEVLDVKKSDKESLELSIDFQDGVWKLQIRVYIQKQ